MSSQVAKNDIDSDVFSDGYKTSVHEAASRVRRIDQNLFDSFAVCLIERFENFVANVVWQLLDDVSKIISVRDSLNDLRDFVGTMID